MQCKKCKREIPDDSNLCCYCGKVYVRKEKTTRRRPRGTGTIYKLKDIRRANPYRVEKNGVRMGDFSSMEAAQLFLDKLNAKASLANVVNWTLDDVHELWLGREYLNLDADTKASYGHAWAKFEPIKQKKMREITTETVQALIDAEIQKGRSRSQQEKIRAMYSVLCKVAMEKDIIDRNYAAFLRLSAQKDVQRDVFTLEEIDRVLADAATSDTSKIIAIFLYTGFRISELISMPLASVDLQNWAFRGGVKTRAGKKRLVPIVEPIRPFVQYFCDAAKGEAFLSGYPGNKEVANFRNRDYYPTLERLGIRTKSRPMNPHSCRYTLATRGHSMGIDNDTLVKILGHAEFDVTSDVYIQEDLDKLHSEMAKLVPAKEEQKK